MEERLIIFISSRINDEMKRARQAVRQAIEELPLTRPWLFEEAPAAADPLELVFSIARCLRSAEAKVGSLGAATNAMLL